MFTKSIVSCYALGNLEQMAGMVEVFDLPQIVEDSDLLDNEDSDDEGDSVDDDKDNTESIFQELTPRGQYLIIWGETVHANTKPAP